MTMVIHTRESEGYVAFCNPSRSSLLSDRRPDSLRVWDNSTHSRTQHSDVATLPLHPDLASPASPTAASELASHDDRGLPMRDGLEVVSLAPVLSDRTKADALLEAKFPRSIPGADR